MKQTSLLLGCALLVASCSPDPLPRPPAAVNCYDGARSADETDIDCGGPLCAPCADQRACAGPGDCQSRSCVAAVCRPISCADGTHNGDEADSDCGGSVCGPCEPGRQCRGAGDCLGGVCQAGRCALPLRVTSISPNRGPLRGGTGVIITGENLPLQPQLRIGDSLVSAVRLSDTQLTALVPMAARSGAVEVVVVDVGGQSARVPGGYRYRYENLAFFESAVISIGMFSPPVPRRPCSGDLNGDGLTDLALATSRGVLVFLNGGQGAVEGPLSVDALSNQNACAIADLDGDGKADLAGTAAGSGQVRVLRGDGTGRAFAELSLTSVSGANAARAWLQAADLSGDGRPDLLLMTADSALGAGTVYTLVNAGKGDGGFLAPRSAGPERHSDLAVADFDGDQRLDVLTPVVTVGVDGLLRGLQLRRGAGDGGFGEPLLLPQGSAAGNQAALVTGDWDEDGRLDAGLLEAGGLRLLRNAGGGAFTVLPASAAFPPGSQLAVGGDVDGDGTPDVIAASDTGALGIALGEGGGALGAVRVINTSSTPLHLQVLDFNGDQRSDIVMVKDGPPRLVVMLNQSF